MTELVHSDDAANRIQELDTYISQALDALKSLRSMKEDADKIIGSLSQKKDELGRHEQDLAEYLKKLQLVSQKAEMLLTPIVDQKQELDTLGKKLSEGITGIEGVVQQKVDAAAEKLDGRISALEGELQTTSESLRKGIETNIADLLKKEDALVKNLSQRIDNCQTVGNSQKLALEGQGKLIERLGKDAVDLRGTIQNLKGMMEKQKEDFKGVVAKQQEEFGGQLEKQKQDLNGAIAELNEKHVKALEKEYAQVKSVLNAVVAKLENVKFKKLLGL